MSERIGLFADIHSNLEAFDACLQQASVLGVTRMVFLGDLVGYNADPVAVVDRVAQEGGGRAMRSLDAAHSRYG